MVRIVIGLVLLFLAGGSWLYLDCLNRKELAQTEQLQKSMNEARSEAKRRAESKSAFEGQLQTTLKSCQDAAEKAKSDYMALLQKSLPSKRGVTVVPQAVLDEGEALMTTAKALCQQEYDTQLRQVM